MIHVTKKKPQRRANFNPSFLAARFEHLRHKAVSADAFAFDSLVGSDLLFPGYSTLQNGEFLVI